MMREPLFTLANQAARFGASGEVIEPTRARDAAALHRATTLAIESAFRFGIDLPVGAVALRANEIIGRGYAGDGRLGAPPLHAETMAIHDATLEELTGENPDTLVVTLEPCDNCQDLLALQPELKRVAFGLAREEVASRGLVKPHDEDIFQRAKRVGLPYELVKIEDVQLQRVGLIILDSVQRDPASGIVSVNTGLLTASLTSYNEQQLVI